MKTLKTLGIACFLMLVSGKMFAQSDTTDVKPKAAKHSQKPSPESDDITAFFKKYQDYVISQRIDYEVQVMDQKSLGAKNSNQSSVQNPTYVLNALKSNLAQLKDPTLSNQQREALQLQTSQLRLLSVTNGEPTRSQNDRAYSQLWQAQAKEAELKKAVIEEKKLPIE